MPTVEGVPPSILTASTQSRRLWMAFGIGNVSYLRTSGPPFGNRLQLSWRTPLITFAIGNEHTRAWGQVNGAKAQIVTSRIRRIGNFYIVGGFGGMRSTGGFVFSKQVCRNGRSAELSHDRGDEWLRMIQTGCADAIARSE